MLSLGVDTSNYATSLAVVDAAAREVVCAVKRMLPVKEGEMGLRQSEAVFHHTAVLPALMDELAAGAKLHAVGAVGASERPRPVEGSYMPCFLAGISFASAFAAARGLRLCRRSHQEGHLAAALLAAPGLSGGDFLFLHASGGTTELLLARGHCVLARLGGSLDLYAGQAVDRLGVKLGFAFPAGAALSALAAECGDDISPKISVAGMDCHFSGLQNQCEALLARGEAPARVARYCLVALADTFCAMAAAARAQHPGLPLLCAGGVTASAVIRARMEERCEGVFFAPPELSADNAVGIAIIAGEEAAHA